MLSLTLKPEEWVYLMTASGTVRMHFRRSREGKIRAVFDAPKGVQIFRETVVVGRARPLDEHRKGNRPHVQQPPNP